MALYPEEKRKNLYEQVYFTIKNAIVSGEFAPGEKLKEMSLAKQLKTSRTPVREALRKLEKDGLVVFSPSQGVIVNKLSKEMVINLYECWSVLGGLAVRKATSVLSESDLILLEETLVLSEQYFAKGDMKRVVEKNTLFHDTIVQASRSKMLLDIMDQVRTHILRYRILTSSFGFRSTFLNEHRDILDELIKRDAEKAEKRMREHIMEDLQGIIDSIYPELR
jgi:DNA-binding GntR family transcriptional regulator